MIEGRNTESSYQVQERGEGQCRWAKAYPAKAKAAYVHEHNRGEPKKSGAIARFVQPQWFARLAVH